MCKDYKPRPAPPSRGPASTASYKTAPPSYTDAVNERTPLFPNPVQGTGQQSRCSCYGLVGESTDEHITGRGYDCSLHAWIMVCVLISIAVSLPLMLLNHTGSGPDTQVPLPTFKVAIIGAGPAGIAAAQHLLDSAPGRQGRFNITMFEAKPVTGGTLAFHNSDGSSLFPYNDREQDPITAEDVAGTALVWNNALFTRDSQKVLGDKVYFTESGSQSVSFYDGTHEKAVTSRPYREMAMGTWLSLLLSYGPSVWRANSLIEGGRLREAMLKAPMTLDAEAVFSSMGILEYVRQSSTTGLKDAGISKQYADQILDPQVRRIYGQGVGQVTNLALMLAAAQEDSANAYEGGNLIDRLNHIVREIGVDVRTSTRVNLVSREMIAENRYTWLVRYESTNARDGVGGDQDDSSVGLEAFDKIIVASYDWKMELLNREARVHSLTSFQDMHADDSNPQSDSDFDFDPSDFDLGAEATTRPPRDYPFVPAHIVFFTTKERIRDQADQVLFEGNKGIREFSFVRDILRYRDFPATVETEYLYRVLSQSPVLDGLQKKYPITWSYQIRIENGFSLSRPLSKMPMFECLWDEDLWWTSVIQHAWNSVDSNWLAGKIVAEDLVQRVLREAT